VTVGDRVAEVLGRTSVRVEGAAPVVTPKSEAETAEILRVAAEHGWRVHPAGARLGPETGEDADLVLSSIEMTGVVEHAPGDLTVRVRSGATLGFLQAELSGARQWLPLDPPGGVGVTLGGVVSTGIPGPLAAEFGRPRDQLLGLTIVDGRGRVLVLGGKVVKNVAGFDLVRLAAGSGGALGVVTEATLRLHPQPELDKVLVWTFTHASEAWSVGRKLVGLPVPVAAAEVIGGDWPVPLPPGGTRVLVRLLGSGGAVSQVAKELISIAGPPEGDFSGEAAGAIFAALSAGETGPGPRFRAHALPSLGGRVVEAITDLEPRRWAAHLLGGTFRGLLTDSGLSRLEAASRKTRAAGGHFRTWGTPLFGIAPESAEPRVSSLTSAILGEFDPSGILPGVWRS
jgi:FAD/FMN-containing dehydrogenase